MFLLHKPSDNAISEFARAEAQLDFTYPDIGATATTPPAHYIVDRTRVCVGTGGSAFERAKSAIQAWKQFDIGWLRATPTDTPIRFGEVVVVIARTFGLWSLNTARIVYVIDERRRFGFAYGTLPGHVEQGEERFLVEQMDDDSVWYDIIAFSRPRHIFTKIGYPLVRRLQKRFGRDSAAAMMRAVNAGESTIV